MHAVPTAANNNVIIPLYFGVKIRSNRTNRTAHNSENIIAASMITSIPIAIALNIIVPAMYLPL